MWTEYRLAGNIPFTAHTVLAASYGLMQLTFLKAVTELGYTQNVGGVAIGRQPSRLFVPGVVVDVGTQLVSEKFRFPRPKRRNPLADEPAFSTLEALQAEFAAAVQHYNAHQVGYGVNVVDRSRNFFPRRE